MHITQGTFSYLPPLSDDEIRAQIQYGIDQGWAVAIEFTDDIHPRNVYWEMWGFPDFDAKDAAAGLFEVNRCRQAYPNHYIRVTLYNPKLTKQTIGLQFIVNRPATEPGFQLVRSEVNDRVINYTLVPYSSGKPHGERYNEGDFAELHGN